MTKTSEERAAAMFHYILTRCSICGVPYTGREHVYDVAAREEYSVVPGKFEDGKVNIRGHAKCMEKFLENPQ